MITIATWPLMQMAQRLLWGKRTLAALLMTSILLLIFVIPLFMTLANVAEKAPCSSSWAPSSANPRPRAALVAASAPGGRQAL